MDNIILMTDSYKASHFLQYPPGTKGMFSYLESRGGVYDRTVFFGLQYLIKRYLSRPVTHADVDEAKVFFAAHGTPFPEAGWRRIVDEHLGLLPVRIKAVTEGAVVPTHNALLTVESLDPECFWIVTWIEAFIMRLWYPITVATQSWHMRRTIRKYLQETGGVEGLNFKLHDFGARGVSSGESAAIGGAAHLAAGWQGSDTVEGVDEMYTELSARGAAIVRPPADTEYGSYEFVVEDVDGRHVGIGRIRDHATFFRGAFQGH